ncbi:unnamed protein product, partial [Prorocentrum cordatum]
GARNYFLDVVLKYDGGNIILEPRIERAPPAFPLGAPPGEGRLVPAPGRQTPARGPQPRGLRAPGRRARVVETPSGRGSRAGPRRGRRARAAARRGEG